MEQNNVSFQNVKTGEPLSQKEIDEMFMRRCLQLAKNGRENAKPNPMVGAVIVSGDGRIIGEGYHVRCGEGHAEVNAFASIKPEDEHLLSQATIYVSLEPCSHYGKTPPCADLIVRKGVKSMWKYIATPLIGAVIGYVTNWIAVKMLFRPRKEIRVFGKRLPFTPGVIPRGQGRLARAVGNALHKNPDPDHIPCFRVVNAKGELAGAFAFGGADVQAELLREDGVEVVDGKVDLTKYQMVDLMEE